MPRPFWNSRFGDNGTLIPSNLSSKRDCGSKRVSGGHTQRKRWPWNELVEDRPFHRRLARFLHSLPAVQEVSPRVWCVILLSVYGTRHAATSTRPVVTSILALLPAHILSRPPQRSRNFLFRDPRDHAALIVGNPCR